MGDAALNIRVERAVDGPQPEHHVLPNKPATGLASYLFSWSPTPCAARDKDLMNGRRQDIVGFRNPWPSFHKATRQEMWNALEWGEDRDPCIQLAESHIPPAAPTPSGSSGNGARGLWKKARELLRTETPDFAFDHASGQKAKSTWLGHAGMLLQLPPLAPGGPPVRVLFDPIFSDRCSPSQVVGPLRSFKPPCRMDELPPIDALLISHTHYDHLDYDSVMAIWRNNQDRLRFVVPLRNRQWFINCGIPPDRVTELDWWDSVYLAAPGSDDDAGRLKISCTPAQHSSVRDGVSADSTLWSGWHLQHERPGQKPYRVFFAGDTGYQFHSSSKWPPKPPPNTTHADLRDGTVFVPEKEAAAAAAAREDEKYPACPAFKEISARLGPPHLLYLPVALGATWAYFRSFFSNTMPAAAVPLPRHSYGVTGAIHMPPWDAVQVLRDMTTGPGADQDDAPGRERDHEGEEEPPPVAIAMHWGTFVTEPGEILKTLGHLEWACYRQDVRFGRGALGEEKEKEEGEPGGGEVNGKKPARRRRFLAVNHGQSVVT